jgi:hypothetical protein
MKKIIISFNVNDKFKYPYKVDNSLTDAQIDTLVNNTFTDIPGEKTWENA